MPLRERELIERIGRMARVSGRRREVLRGIGDDCAVLRLPAGAEILVTTDFTIEGVHFRREWLSAEAVGHRCLARGLSDIAAMGGEPMAAFLSLGLPAEVEQKWVDGFLRGFLKLARRFGVELAGGDIAESPDRTAADVMVIGRAGRGRAVRRSGARPGDRIYVTGKLGGAAALLDQLRGGMRVPPNDRRFLPEPRVKAGRALARWATAMIDLSDGLSTDLGHICEESGVGAQVRGKLVPLAKGATLEHALHGGEDYELLFTTSRRMPAEVGGVRVHQIGEIVKGDAIHLSTDEESMVLEPRGWEHFRRR